MKKVYPDGRSILIAEHPRRVSFRKSLNEPSVVSDFPLFPSISNQLYSMFTLFTFAGARVGE